MSGECDRCEEHTLDSKCKNKVMMIKDHVEYFLNNMNADDFRIIGEILAWDNEKKLGFMAAKRIFEDVSELYQPVNQPIRIIIDK